MCALIKPSVSNTHKKHVQKKLLLPASALCVLIAISCVEIWKSTLRPLPHPKHNHRTRHRFTHAGCHVRRLPDNLHQTKWRWIKSDESWILVWGGRMHRLPNYVDCPYVHHRPFWLPTSILVAPFQKSMLSLFKEGNFDSLPASIVDAACHSRHGASNTPQDHRAKHAKKWTTLHRPRSVPKTASRTQPTAMSTNQVRSTRKPSNRAVCVVVRFYGGQLGSNAQYTLDAAISSLTTQQGAHVNVVLVHTDASNITAVSDLLNRHKSDRIELVTFQDLARVPIARVNHRTTWFATEKAIASCPESARWLLITNGDNFYHETFFNHLDDTYDIVAFDFYTRHRPAWSRGECDSYGVRDGLNQGCLPNRLRLCETDLGAVVVNLARWRRERRRFTEHESFNGSEDGLLIEAMVQDGWSNKRVSGALTGACLFDHNPNYHSCLQLSNTTYWDDRAQQCVDVTREMDNLRVLTRRRGPAERCLM